jgi:ferredoxin, 2Fe-2S
LLRHRAGCGEVRFVIAVRVTHADGSTVTIAAEAGGSLMEVLRDKSLVMGTCGGMCSCGTCHVYVCNSCSLPQPTEEERDMLEALNEIIEIDERSRLSCQIILEEGHDGLHVKIAEQSE